MIKNPSLFEAVELIETGIPGQEIAIAGAIVGNDSANQVHQAVFLMQTSFSGIPKQFNFYEDQTYFLVFGPRAFDLAYDGADNFYLALGSNDNQIVVKTSIDGTYKWGTKVDHHSFFSIHSEDNGVVVMGQDESIQGIHDYSMVRIDSNGAPTPGQMFGTTEFDTPEEMIVTDDGFVMAGFTFYAGQFNPMIIKCNKNFDKTWSQIITSPGKHISCTGIAAAIDGSGYVAVGTSVTLAGGPDSLFAIKLDTAGSTEWVKFYGIDSTEKVAATGVASDPLGRGFLVCGSYKQPGYYDQPMVMRINKAGNAVWARGYGEQDTMHEERVRDVMVRENGSFFYGMAESAKVDSNFNVTRRLFMLKADVITGAIPCDTLLSVGSSTPVIVPGGGTHTEPFFDSTAYPFAGFGGQMTMEVACSVMVATPEPPPVGNAFSFVNPATDELVVDYNLDLESRDLRLMDAQGRLLRTFTLPVSQSRARFSLRGLAQGIYFLVGQRDFWDTPVQRLLITR